MVNRKVLIKTATQYEHYVKSDSSYSFPSKVLNSAVEQLYSKEELDDISIDNSDQYVVIRAKKASNEQELIRCPLDLFDKGVAAGIESLKIRGMLESEQVCLIAVPRGSLTGTFTFIYEVVRKSDWSVLPLGGSVDGQDISSLCNAYKVDTLIVASDAIESIFTSSMVGQFNTLRNLMYMSGVPSPKVFHLIETQFPHIILRPFIYYSDVVGPIDLPAKGSENDGFIALENVLVEVELADGTVALNGSGRILASVLGLEQPMLIRRDTSYYGMLTTTKDGKQTVHLQKETLRDA